MDAGVRPAREPNLTLLVRRRSMVQSSVLQRSSRDWGFGNERAGQRRAVGRRGGSSPRWSGLRQRRAARWYESRLPCHSARERLSPPALPPPPERAFDLPAFLPAKPDLSDKKAGYFTNVDGMNRFALVAVDPERPQEIIGVVSFDRERSPERAEYAAEVEDKWQGRGLGMALTRRLIEAALKRGIRGLLSSATAADQVGCVRLDPGCRGNLPSSSAGGPLVGRRGYAPHATVSQNGLCVVLNAHPAVHRRSRITLAPVRYRRGHKPHPRLRLSDRHAGRPLLRRHRSVAAPLRRPHRREIHPRSGGLYPRHSRVVQSLEAPYPVLHRQALLQEEVRREKDPGSLLGPVARRNRPERAERRPGRCGEGDDAARPRLAVVAPRDGSEGRACTIAAALFTRVRGRRILRSSDATLVL